jgi:putative ABC transport system substrate-binding protein
MPAMTADLIGRKVAVILAGGYASGVRATIATTQTIPIVFTTQTDPVAAGFVASLNKPGGNVTGVTGLGVELVPKVLEVLHEMLPKTAKFAVLLNPNNPILMRDTVRGAQTVAGRLGLEIIFLNAATQNEIDSAFAAAAARALLGCLLTMPISRAVATKSLHWVCAINSPRRLEERAKAWQLAC